MTNDKLGASSLKDMGIYQAESVSWRDVIGYIMGNVGSSIFRSQDISASAASILTDLLEMWVYDKTA